MTVLMQTGDFLPEDKGNALSRGAFLQLASVFRIISLENSMSGGDHRHFRFESSKRLRHFNTGRTGAHDEHSLWLRSQLEESFVRQHRFEEGRRPGPATRGDYKEA